MENKKFEELIDLIINENEDKARELFHEIVVEKSREIYEQIMDEEMNVDEGSQALGLLDEISAEMDSEEAGGVKEAEDDVDADFDDAAEELGAEAGDEMTHDIEDAHDEESGEEDLEDRIVKVEDKIDELLADFERIMGDEEDMGDEDMGDEDMGDEDASAEMMEASDDEEAVEEDIMEATELKKVPAVKHGDDGANTKSPTLNKPRVEAAGVKPVNFSSGGSENPDGKQYKDPKGNSPKDLPGAGKFMNTAGAAGRKLENAPKPKHGDDGSNKVSPVAKSK
jgi:hypothetical protein